jgi:hypothetical protein
MIFVHEELIFVFDRDMELFPKGIGEEIRFRKKWS